MAERQSALLLSQLPVFNLNLTNRVGGSILYPPIYPPIAPGCYPSCWKISKKTSLSLLMPITRPVSPAITLSSVQPYWPCSADHHNGTSAFGFGPALKSNPNWLKGSPMCLTLLGWLMRILGLWRLKLKKLILKRWVLTQAYSLCHPALSFKGGIDTPSEVSLNINPIFLERLCGERFIKEGTKYVCRFDR